MLAAIIDAVIIVLLIGSITYGYLVSRKVRLLMATLKELEPLVEEFSSAVDKSEYSVLQMRQNLEVAERRPEPAPEPEPQPQPQMDTAFSSRRHVPVPPEQPGVRMVRDKKDLVRAFFDTAETARA